MSGASSRSRTKSIRFPNEVYNEIEAYARRHGMTYNEVVVQRCLALRDRRFAAPDGTEPDESIFDALAESRAAESARPAAPGATPPPGAAGTDRGRELRDAQERNARSVARSLTAAADAAIDESRRMTEDAIAAGEEGSASAQALQDTLSWLESYELLAEHRVEALRAVDRAERRGRK